MSKRLFELIFHNSEAHITQVDVVLIVITGALDGLKMSSSLWGLQAFVTGTNFVCLFPEKSTPIL